VTALYTTIARAARKTVRHTRTGRFISDNPFSTLALSSMAGDACYLGYAFYASDGPSFMRLIGAASALLGNIFILAYGDAQAGKIALETGWAARLFLRLRHMAQFVLHNLTGRTAMRQPLFRGFGLLAVNGAALTADALTRPHTGTSSQLLLGIFVTIGCGCFAAADLAVTQRTANILMRVAPTTLAIANIPGLALGITTHNPFLLLGTGLFLIGNLGGFFTHVDKDS
jgi:hypothetical protein